MQKLSSVAHRSSPDIGQVSTRAQFRCRYASLLVAALCSLGAASAFGGANAADASGPLQVPAVTPAGNWVSAKGGAIPRDAVQGGNEADGAPLYVCRVAYNGSVLPGKVRTAFGGCNFPFGGQEVTAPEYEVLVGGGYRWVPQSNGTIPGGAVQAGYDLPPQSPSLFVCQAQYKGGVHPGKIRPDWNACDISWGGGEIFVQVYSVLVR